MNVSLSRCPELWIAELLWIAHADSDCCYAVRWAASAPPTQRTQQLQWRSNKVACWRTHRLLASFGRAWLTKSLSDRHQCSQKRHAVSMQAPTLFHAFWILFLASCSVVKCITARLLARTSPNACLADLVCAVHQCVLRYKRLMRCRGHVKGGNDLVQWQACDTPFENCLVGAGVINSQLAQQMEVQQSSDCYGGYAAFAIRHHAPRRWPLE